MSRATAALAAALAMSYKLSAARVLGTGRTISRLGAGCVAAPALRPAIVIHRL